MKGRFGKFIQYAIPLVIFLALWEISVSDNTRAQFLFASPSLVGKRILGDLLRGSLLEDTWITALETVLGLSLGSAVGASFGLALWASNSVARIARPYVVALSAIPIFAIAPMTVIWFGTGFFAKAMMAALSTVFVALVQAYEGAKNTDARLISLAKSFGATKLQVFKKVVLPSALVWVMLSCRLNVGFALLGAFIGEFISSRRGLGHYILKGSGLYDVPGVLSGVICIIALSLILTAVVSGMERLVMPWTPRRGNS
jgi:NitT/TauT family transport system permease protein